jgi:hypothetical protein
LNSLVGLCVGCRIGRTHGVRLWARVIEYRKYPTGCLLRVNHSLWSRPRWVDGKDVAPRTKRDAAILAEANAALTGGVLAVPSNGVVGQLP